MKGISNTTTSNFSQLIGTRIKYEVPKYQRDYSWNIEQWEDLWEDIELIVTGQVEQHYLGYLVIQYDSLNRLNYIIDGQQRFTTLTLLILAAMKVVKGLISNKIDVNDNKVRLDRLMSIYIKYQNPITLKDEHLLRLNRNNNSFFEEITKLGSLRTQGLSTTEKLSKDCFVYFENKIKAKYIVGMEIAEFIEHITNSFYFTVITVSDELNAFRVFETLNARGTQLSSTDLLKNYMYSVVDQCPDKSLIVDLDNNWSTLTNSVKSLPDFIRYCWNTKYKLVRKSELFVEIKKTLSNSDLILPFIDELISFSTIYNALQSPENILWKGYPSSVKSNLELLKLLGFKQPLIALMPACKYLMPDQFDQFLSDTVSFGIRYSTICGKNPNDMEKLYNKIAIKISTSFIYDRELFRTLYVNDVEFVNAFSGCVVRGARGSDTLKYLLLKLEGADLSTNEVILYKLQTFQGTIKSLVEPRYGNFCILLKEECDRLAGDSVEDINVFAESKFSTTRSISISKSQNWNLSDIDNRQFLLAEKAKNIWKINF